MHFSIEAALKTPGVPYVFNLYERFDPISFGTDTIVFASPVILAGTFVFDGEGFTLKGDLSTSIATSCARCNRPLIENLKADFTERFAKARPEGDVDTYLYEGSTLELNDMVVSNVLLNIPIASLCSEDCKGLCPKCGADLNVEQCACAREEKGNPFHALGKLRAEDEEV